MLRLTLGIPGFDEAQLPRVIAALCLGLLAINRVASSGAPSDAQVSAVLLPCSCWLLPRADATAQCRRVLSCLALRSQLHALWRLAWATASRLFCEQHRASAAAQLTPRGGCSSSHLA